VASNENQRAKKQALVEAELQDAISALRKPNRGLAGKAMVEAAERRASGGLSAIRSLYSLLDIRGNGANMS
jgi:hypothetical protein